MISVGINALGIGKEPVGTGQYTYQLIKGLAKVDRINNYLVIKNRNSGIETTENKNIQYIDVVFYNRLYRILLENIYLPHIIRRKRLNLFHSPIFTLPLRMPIPCIVTIHDLVVYKFPQTIDLKRRLYLRSVIRYSIAKADRIIAVSECTRKDILEYFKTAQDKIEVVHEAAASCFAPLDNEILATRVCGHYKIRQPYILYVGTIEPRKNLLALIRAYGRLKNGAGVKQSLVIAGKKGWYYDAVFSEVRGRSLENDVIFTGYVPNQHLLYLYNAADLFVLPSLYEGFGLPILEAMACGTPVLTSNVSAMLEVAGDAAILVDPYDIDAIAEAMHRVLTDQDLRAELRRRGLERVKQFSWERCARETIKVYEKAVSNG